MSVVPTELSYHRKSRRFEIAFDGGERYAMSAEFLRVYSPSADVRGHSPGQEVLQTGKRNVSVLEIEAVGNYAVCLHFDDGHRTGIYSWEELHWLGENHDELWAHYLERIQEAGAQR